MKIRSPLLASAAAVASCALVWQPASAQPVQGPYVSLGGGIGLLQDETERVASQQYQAFVPAPGPLFVSGYQRQVFTHAPQRIRFAYDPGFAGQVSAGWGVGHGLRVELEGTYAYNHVRKPETPVSERAGGFQQRYGGFVNVLYDIDLHLPVYRMSASARGARTSRITGPTTASPSCRTATTIAISRARSPTRPSSA